MNRILEHVPSPEEPVVSRILVQVHKAVDEHFPNAETAGRQFTKTVFSDESESTAIARIPTEDIMEAPAAMEFSAEDVTASAARAAQDDPFSKEAGVRLPGLPKPPPSSGARALCSP